MYGPIKYDHCTLGASVGRNHIEETGTVQRQRECRASRESGARNDRSQRPILWPCNGEYLRPDCSYETAGRACGTWVLLVCSVGVEDVRARRERRGSLPCKGLTVPRGGDPWTL